MSFEKYSLVKSSFILLILKIKRILLILSLLHYGRLNPSGAVKECSISYLFVEAYCLNIKDLAIAERILLLSAAAYCRA
jgi:hypothetical protein